jgi:hypothetical protein
MEAYAYRHCRQGMHREERIERCIGEPRKRCALDGFSRPLKNPPLSSQEEKGGLEKARDTPGYAAGARTQASYDQV